MAHKNMNFSLTDFQFKFGVFPRGLSYRAGFHLILTLIRLPLAQAALEKKKQSSEDLWVDLLCP